MPVIGSIDLERRFVVRIVERVAEHYDVEERAFGRIYRWRPASVVTECYCGEKSHLTPSKTTCQVCGLDLSEAIREVLPPRQETRNFTPGATQGIAKASDCLVEQVLQPSRAADIKRTSLIQESEPDE